MNKKNLVKEALSLPVSERADMIDTLIKSLYKPDQTIDQLWKEEAEERIDMYEKGQLSTLSVEEVIEKYKKAP